MKNIRQVIVILGFACLAAAVVAGVSLVAGHYLTARGEAAAPATGACSGQHAVHTVTIKDDKLVPQHTQAVLCDKLAIVNRDAKQREIGFGEHEHHVPYNGVAERILNEDQSFTVVLNKAGTYKFHDHFQDEVAGSFTVTK